MAADEGRWVPVVGYDEEIVNERYLPPHPEDDESIFLSTAEVSDLVSIHEQEKAEPTYRKVLRTVVDNTLDNAGNTAAGAIGGLTMYRRTKRVLPTVAGVVGGLVGHGIIRRPLVEARHRHHQATNPLSPAAQSTARLRKKLSSPPEFL